MSVIVKGMDMPKNCCDCDFEANPRGAHYCQLEMRAIESLDRPDWCPLVELPNTDLVDADTIEFWGETWTGKIVVHREKENDHE